MPRLLKVMKNAVEQFLTEASLGCLMAVLPTADAAPVAEWAHEKIAPTDLVGDGYENSPHVTLAYGFEAGVSAVEMQQAVSSWGRSNLRFTLGPIARFDTSPEHDVLYASVKFDSDLRQLHDHLVHVFGKRLQESFPDYRPHMCLAYVRKGACRSLNGHSKWDDATYSLDSLVFSLPESILKFPIALGIEESVLPPSAKTRRVRV